MALHRAVLERLERDPALLDGVRTRLEAWRLDETKPQRYVEASEKLLDGRRAALRAVLTSDDEDPRALRQATPFAGFVEPRERWRIWAEVKRTATELL